MHITPSTVDRQPSTGGTYLSLLPASNVVA